MGLIRGRCSTAPRNAVFSSVKARAQIAQLVEQGIENPRVGSSILSLGTIYSSRQESSLRLVLYPRQPQRANGCPNQTLGHVVQTILRRQTHALKNLGPMSAQPTTDHKSLLPAETPNTDRRGKRKRSGASALADVALSALQVPRGCLLPARELRCLRTVLSLINTCHHSYSVDEVL